MLFDELRAQARDMRAASVPASWAQGRTVYGGLSAGLLCDALCREIDPARRLRYLEVGFLKPLEAEMPFQVETKERSAGRTVVVRTGRIVQDGIPRVTAQANFIRQLESSVSVDRFEAPGLPRRGAPGTFPMRGPHLPAFTQHFDFVAATGVLPFQGHAQPDLGGWMRFEVPPEVFTKAHLVCLIDTWPPAPSPCYERMVPLSTINWGIHFAEPLDGIGGDDDLGYLARTSFFKDGYGSSTADVWAPDGRLLAKSYQTFLFYG